MPTDTGSGEQPSSEHSSHIMAENTPPGDLELEQSDSSEIRQFEPEWFATIAGGDGPNEDAVDAKWCAAQRTALELVLDVFKQIQQPQSELKDAVAAIRKISKNMPIIHSLLGGLGGLETAFDSLDAFSDILLWIHEIDVLTVSADRFTQHVNTLEDLEVRRELRVKSKARRHRRLETKNYSIEQLSSLAARNEIFGHVSPRAMRSSMWRVCQAETKRKFLSEERLATSQIAFGCKERVAELLGKIRKGLPKCEEFLHDPMALLKDFEW